MCGLFGWNLTRDVVASERVALAMMLAVEMNERGDQSWGAWTPDGNFLVKDVGSILDAANTMRLSQFDALAVHTRYATHGDVNLTNAHPFRAGDIVGAHNGCVWNDYALDVQYPERRFGVDSMHLIAHIAEGRSLKELEGYGAVVWSDARDPGAYYMGRFCGGELTVAVVLGATGDDAPRGLVWASTEYALRHALATAGLVRYSILRLKERVVYRLADGKLSRTTMRLTVRERCTRITSTTTMHAASPVSDYDKARECGFVSKEREANQAALAWLKEDSETATREDAERGRTWAKHEGTSREGTWRIRREPPYNGKTLRDGFKRLAGADGCEACGATLVFAKEYREGVCADCQEVEARAKYSA